MVSNFNKLDFAKSNRRLRLKMVLRRTPAMGLRFWRTVLFCLILVKFQAVEVTLTDENPSVVEVAHSSIDPYGLAIEKEGQGQVEEKVEEQVEQPRCPDRCQSWFDGCQTCRFGRLYLHPNFQS